MISTFLVSILATTASDFNPVVRRNDDSTANNQTLISQLITAATAVDRQALMPDDAQYVYDFQHPPVEDVITKGLGGMTVKADRKAFPLLIGNGVSMTVGFLGPCGFNTPHVHPRSAEINIAVQGHFATEYTLENGARSILNTLEQYQMTVFPQGALHAEWNPDCTNAVFVAGFASEDPGVQQAAQTLLGFSEEFVSPVFGSNNITFDGKDVDTFRAILPKNVALGIDTCLAKCGIQKSAKQALVEV